MIYYTSDLHLGHENIIRLCNRPYKTVDEMNSDIVRRWNDKVKPTDTVYILGDMFFKFQDMEYVKSTLKKLNGRKYLIEGNHDSFLNSLNRWSNYFEWVGDYKRISDNGRQVILMHYPIEEWDGFFRGNYHLYGHVHNNDNGLRNISKRYNVGVDVNDFEPKTLDELIERNDTK